MVTTFHQILSFYIVPWRPAKIQVHWVNGTLRNCGRTGLALSTPALSAFQLFLWIFSTPGLPFTTASLVIYGNPCGMQDGYSIFIENYQSEDLGSIHRRSKPSLHLPDSFRLKLSENLATKTFQKFWETVFSSTKVLTGADTSAPLAGILNLIYPGSQCLCPGWDVCFLSTVMWVFNTCWAWTEFFFNLIWFPQNKNQHSSSCSCLVVWTDQSPSAMLHYKNCT